jgi:hypothetical protein
MHIMYQLYTLLKCVSGFKWLFSYQTEGVVNLIKSTAVEYTFFKWVPLSFASLIVLDIHLYEMQIHGGAGVAQSVKWLGTGWTTSVRFPEGAKSFSFRHRYVQTSSGVLSGRGVKLSTHVHVVQSLMRGAIPPLPPMFSCCGTWLSTGPALALPLHVSASATSYSTVILISQSSYLALRSLFITSRSVLTDSCK